MTWKEIGRYLKNASDVLFGAERSIRYFIGDRVDEEVPEFLCMKIRRALGDLCFALNEMQEEIHILTCGDKADDVREAIELIKKHADDERNQLHPRKDDEQ